METRSPTAAEFNGSSAVPSYANQGSLPRPAAGSSGLSELDSLLQDLQNARYNGSDKKGKSEGLVLKEYRINIDSL